MDKWDVCIKVNVVVMADSEEEAVDKAYEFISVEPMIQSEFELLAVNPE